MIMNKTAFAVICASGCGRGVVPLARQQLQSATKPCCNVLSTFTFLDGLSVIFGQLQ